jgi:hypothetical protein
MRRLLLFIAFSVLVLPLEAQAGGAHQTTIDGIPYRWEKPLVYNLDRGDLKAGDSDFSRDQVAQIIAEAFATWTGALNGASLGVSEGESLPLAADGLGDDVNLGNYSVYLNSSKAVNPIVLDADGEVLDAVFGSCAKFNTLAFAGFEKVNQDSASIEKARAVFSGACIPDASGKTVTKDGCGPCALTLDESKVRRMVVHEIGHLLGMDHSQVNPESYSSCRATGSCSVALEEDIPTMFPMLVEGAKQETLHADDIAYFNRLYGQPELDTCGVEGKVLASDGGTELRGVEVVLRSADARFEREEALAFISGAEAPRLRPSDKTAANCAGDCGTYRITGLQPGETYQVCVQNILSQFQGGSGLEPVDVAQAQVKAECFPDLTVTCECDGESCAQLSGIDIVTHPFDGASASASGNLSEDAGPGAGGCSLVPTRPSRVWVRLKNLLVFADRFQ